ncbi:hypothetical protein J4477_00380 [Candidatus Pacearchaeota archaeon]|nr:hypothetical protein [Candidatus Pacearchaeota archaeon]
MDLAQIVRNLDLDPLSDDGSLEITFSDSAIKMIDSDLIYTTQDYEQSKKRFNLLAKQCPNNPYIRGLHQEIEKTTPEQEINHYSYCLSDVQDLTVLEELIREYSAIAKS